MGATCIAVILEMEPSAIFRAVDTGVMHVSSYLCARNRRKFVFPPPHSCFGSVCFSTDSASTARHGASTSARHAASMADRCERAMLANSNKKDSDIASTPKGWIAKVVRGRPSLVLGDR